MEQRKKPPRLRGYRIRVTRPGRPSVDLPFMWRVEPPLQEWEQVKQDSSIVQATLYRSGKKFAYFRRA